MRVDQLLGWIESEIKKQKFGNEPRSLYEPLRYIMALGGKRLRPLLTLLSYSLYKRDVRTIVPIAIAVEVFHNFTLLHDDIMDNAPLRRGNPTVHEKWDVNTAILSGDVMQIKVYSLLLGIENSKLKEALTAFNQCATEVCEGQQWDMEFESKSNVTEAAYLEMIRLKTASLLGFSLELGALLAGAPHDDQHALRELGIHIGMGFQLRDDLLDVYADKRKFGKQVGGDIIANKKTFLLINALAKAKGNDKKELTRWLKKQTFDKKRKIEAITKIYDSLGIRSLTERKINHYFKKGYTYLERIQGINKKELVEFTESIRNREA
jgi:geranylgeranyl diphosphate synthase type II